MTKKSESGWTVVGKYGAYYDSFARTRYSAIRAHVRNYKELPYGWGCTLTPQEKAVWTDCQKNGDRVVKATLNWSE